MLFGHPPSMTSSLLSSKPTTKISKRRQNSNSKHRHGDFDYDNDDIDGDDVWTTSSHTATSGRSGGGRRHSHNAPGRRDKHKRKDYHSNGGVHVNGSSNLTSTSWNVDDGGMRVDRKKKRRVDNNDVEDDEDSMKHSKLVMFLD